MFHSIPPSQFQYFLIILAIYLYIIISRMYISIYAYISTYWVYLALLVGSCIQGLSQWTTCIMFSSSSSSRVPPLENFFHPHWCAGFVQATMMIKFPGWGFLISREHDLETWILVNGVLQSFCPLPVIFYEPKWAKLVFTNVSLRVGQPKISYLFTEFWPAMDLSIRLHLLQVQACLMRTGSYTYLWLWEQVFKMLLAIILLLDNGVIRFYSRVCDLPSHW